MRAKLTPYRMGDFLKVKHGYAFLGEYFLNNGKYIVLTPGNFYESGGFKRIRGKEKYYTSDFPGEYLCSKGDLVVAMTEQADGLLGSTAIIPEEDVYLHNQRIGLISWDPSIIDKQYLYYLFMTKTVRKQIRDSASGTKVKHTSPDRIYDVNVFLPDLTVQKNNASLLWTIEQKILLNNRIINELEEMAKVIYDFWFLQFDFPNEEGKPYRSSGGEMVWDEKLKREIPNGWESFTVGEMLDKTPNSTRIQSSAYMQEGSIPIIDQSIEYIAGYTNNTSAIVSVTNGVIIFGDHTRNVKFIDFDFARGADGTQVLISNDLTKMPQLLFYHAIKRIDLSNYGYARHFKFLKDCLIVIPDKKTAEQFNKKVEPMYKLISQKVFENLELKKNNKWLMPILMNGQATIEK